MRLILEVKNPTDELTGIYFSLWSWDISLTLNMTYFFILRHSERSEESHRVSKRRMYCSLFRWDILLTLNMTYFYPLSSALPTLRLRGGRAPFIAIATIPPFQRGNLPRRRKRVLFSVILNEVKNPTEELTIHIPLTLVVGYFADAQYDVKTQVEYFAYLNMTMFFILRHPER